MSNCCSVSHYNRSESLFPISATDQSSISNDADIGTPINGDAIVDHHYPTTTYDTSLSGHRIFSTATFPADEYMPIIRMNSKTGHFIEKNITPFTSPVHIHYSPLFAGATVPCC
ncbi:hypothetical protein TNCV_1363601 [Trichonephila clavipes]|uniref:Uncharacterized protein n=1 Tax=Trichonephila clavipes TaxID=2585209 RepID=A0A8X6VB14_TRICX|nr:hypothetical protein TNCV_1363601 [Trichonephila clavipes]